MLKTIVNQKIAKLDILYLKLNSLKKEFNKNSISYIEYLKEKERLESLIFNIFNK